MKYIVHIHRSDMHGCFWLREENGTFNVTRRIEYACELCENEVIHAVTDFAVLCAGIDGLLIEATYHPVEAKNLLPLHMRKLLRLDTARL